MAKRRGGGWLLATVLAAIAVVGCQPVEGDAHAEGIATAEEMVSRWLEQIESGDNDHGFALLHPELKTAKMRALYESAFDDVHEMDIAWRILPQTDPETSEFAEFYRVTVELVGGSAAMPRELVDAELAQPHLLDSVDEGIVVIVRIDGRGAGVWTPQESSYRD